MAAGSWDGELSAPELREIIVVPRAEERWLWRVEGHKVDAGDVQDEDGGKARVKIPKVSWEVTDKKWYEPEAVSIGPYHYNKEPKAKLRKVQELKVRFASTYVRETWNSSATVKEVYDKVSKVAGEAREYYSQDALRGMTDEEFTDVMFLDGCFVLEFILRGSRIGFTKHLQMDLNLKRLVVRDLFLLDNQVPFLVLEALSTSLTDLTVSVLDFLTVFSYAGIGYDKFQNNETKPIHLLDFLSLCLCDPHHPRDRPPRIAPNDDWMSCPSVTRLEEAGIDCWPTKSLRLTAIRFTSRLLTAELKIPPVYIGDHFTPKWMNLAAYQIYAAPDRQTSKGINNIGAAEYVWMLDKLIDDAEDVRKLRAKQIIVHNLESDQVVVTLVKSMSKNIARDVKGIRKRLPMRSDDEGGRVLVKEIQNHMRSEHRRWVYKNLYRPYLRDSWSIPTVFAVLSLVLTCLQVYYAIHPRQPI